MASGEVDGSFAVGEVVRLTLRPGYNGDANPSLPVIKVKAITMRTNAILQMLVESGEALVSLASTPTETSIYNELEDALPGLLQNV